MSEIDDQFQVLPASIGGASFQMHVSKQLVGRRRALQEYPNTEFVTEQDLGAKADDFTIVGHVAGADYLSKKKALKDVFRGVGPFLLVHPFEGRFLVKVDGDLSIDEDIAKLGWADISFKCKRATRDDIGRVVDDPRDTAPAVVSAARLAAADTAAAATSRLSIASVRAAFQAKIAVVQETLAGSLGTAIDVTNEAGAAVVASVDDLVDVTDSLIEFPVDLFKAIAETVNGVVKAPFVVETTATSVYGAFSDGDRILAMLDIAGRFVRLDEVPLEELAPGCLSEEPSDDDTNAEAATRNGQAITACVRAEAIAAMLESILETLPDSRGQAADILAMITKLLLGQSDGDPDALLHSVDAESFVALSDMRASATAYIASLKDLPTIETYTVPAETNVLLLAQLLLGDASRFAEIVSRNQLADPLFVPAGAEIEYLRAA